ncbi:MAG TPA: hypothetical protein VL334_19225 [Anaerolineae bacterium]|nr:hypothetical protein [Anaerolineae bacterium]
MNETITLLLPERVTVTARQVAKHTKRRLEDVLLDWLDRSAEDLPIEMLADDQVLLLAGSQLPADEQQELSNLLASNREGTLSARQHIRLDELMQLYRRGLVRKAQANQVAVDRGLLPPLN